MLAIKHKKFGDDPEMFATYLALAQEACVAVKAHRERLIDQIAAILSDGVKQGAFEVADLKATARAVFEATVRYHHPAHSEEWKDPAMPARIDALLALLLRGLEAPRKR
jgi:erythromycin esterase-like protein